MGEIKVNFKFNLVKLITLQALSLRPGLYDARQVCALTGLRYTTVSTHLAYWAETMCDKQGRPVRLLKRVPSVSGRKLAWRYSLSYPGKRWLAGVNPDLREDVSSKLALRWAQHLTSYDLPNDEPLTRLTSLKQNLPLDSITLQHSESVYLKGDDGTIIRFASSSYQGHSVQRIPYGAKWAVNPLVVFNALTELLGKENIPICEAFIKVGLQRWDIESESNTPTNNEIVPEIKADAAPVEETWEERKAREEAYALAARMRRKY